MKTLKLIGFASLLSIVSLAAVSCDGGGKTPEPLTADQTVAGNYTGTMTCTPETTPAGRSTAPKEAEEPIGEAASFKIADKKIVFTAFPLESIIVAVVGDEMAAGIIEAVGNIPYDIAFTAAFNEDETEVDMELAPEELVLTIIGPEPEGASTYAEGEEPASMEIKVTVSVEEDANYVVGTKKLGFSLKVDKVLLMGTELPGFTPLILDLDAVKK